LSQRDHDLRTSPALAPLIRRWERRVPLSQADKDALLALPHQVRTCGRDAYLVREGEGTSTCNLLLSGFAYRQKLVNNGARQIISFHIPGEFVDLQNALLEVADHNVQSLSACDVAVIPKSALLDLMAARPAIGNAAWLDTLIDASIFREWVVNVGRRSARTRISHLLCELALRLRTCGASSGPTYDFPLTQEQLADATGLTPVHTNRTLQALRREGLISLTANKLTVLDWDGLAQAGDFSERYLHHGA
jgi:CRP-like cAMP-binding protein